MPQAAALEEIQRNAGIQFDPDVVKAFARLMARNPEPIEEAA
jgi:HD-GYP domain-containing protein (c-di-GMP phosphodiesterase class II)